MEGGGGGGGEGGWLLCIPLPHCSGRPDLITIKAFLNCLIISIDLIFIIMIIFKLKKKNPKLTNC